MKNQRTIASLRLALTFLYCISVSHAWCAVPARLIATGWDSPTAAVFRAQASEFEKWPFDGVTIFPTIERAAGGFVSNGYVFNREKWATDACAGMIKDLQATHSRIKRHSFLFCHANPGDVDWFDDAGWAQIVNHWRQLARAAKMGGVRGLLFDAEPYTPPYQQFNDTHQAGAKRHTFEEYAAKARFRGREVMQAVASVYPDATIFSYRLLSDLLPLTGGSGDPRQALSGNTYALLPAFVDGWLDVAPPTLTLIEGDEDIGYRANSPATFDRAFARLRLEIPSLLDPSNAGKYQAQVRISHGLYLDAYTNAPNNPWYIDPLGGTPAVRLEANTSAAFHAADSGYVWIYGETGRWWPAPTGAKQYQLWSVKLPGSEAALLRAKDPAAAAQALLNSARPTDNLLKNGDFAVRGGDGLPSDWWTWQNDTSHGQAALEGGTIRWSGASEAVFGQIIPIKPHVRYALGAQMRRQGHGNTMISIGWKDPKGQWSNQGDNVVFLPLSTSSTLSWGEASGLVTAPSGSGFMVVMFAASGQTGPRDQATCRNIRCIEVR